MNGIIALIKVAPESWLAFLPHEDIATSCQSMN
jgi:hypothetical protein